MPKTEYEKGYEDGFSDGFRLCQKIYSNVIDLLCKAFKKKEQKERKLISEQPQRRSERRGFRDIPIDGNLQVGDVIYTKANTVLDIGIVKSVSPLEVYSRCTRYDYGYYPSLYGAPELCRWYNSGVNVSFVRWKEISYDAGTDDVCRAIGIPYLRC